MTNTDTRDAVATIAQIRALVDAGCQIVRCTVPDMEAAGALKAIRAACPIPLVADVHFDHRLAMAALENGADKVRINRETSAGRIRSGSWWPAPRTMGPPSASG